MTDELRLNGIGVAPGVLDTIVTLAARGVEGVACVESGAGLAGLVQRGGGKSLIVSADEAGVLSVSVHVTLEYGPPLHETAAKVQSAIAEALTNQIGQPVGGIDVFVDAVAFSD
jgi:uncharacterized alkaline shock family protein YloU